MGEKGTNLVIAITGSPGVGKTSVCTNLSDLGFRVTSVLDLAKAYSCLGPLEPNFDSKSVDIDKLSEVANLDEFDFIDGHLSHHLDVDAIVILRCSPSLLKERLSQRGYGDQEGHGKYRMGVHCWNLFGINRLAKTYFGSGYNKIKYRRVGIEN